MIDLEVGGIVQQMVQEQSTSWGNIQAKYSHMTMNMKLGVDAMCNVLLAEVTSRTFNSLHDFV